MGLTFEVKGEEAFQLKKRWLDVAEVPRLYIYFAGSRMVGLCTCVCTLKEQYCRKGEISTNLHLGSVMK